MVAHQLLIQRIRDILERLITEEMPGDLHQKGIPIFLRKPRIAKLLFTKCTIGRKNSDA